MILSKGLLCSHCGRYTTVIPNVRFKLKEVIELASYFISVWGTNRLRSHSLFVRLEYALFENILKAEVITF